MKSSLLCVFIFLSHHTVKKKISSQFIWSKMSVITGGPNSSQLKTVVGIHPLVIASSCDHFTRVSTGGSKLPSSAPVFGLLFGFDNGKGISVCESTEALYEINSGEVVPMLAEIEKKIKLWTAVYTNYSLLGWYAFGSNALPCHLKFHQTIATLTKNPIFLLVNDSFAAVDTSSDRMPLTVFVVEEQKFFLETLFVIETSQVEKVALDQIMKATPAVGLSPLELQNQTMLSSLNTLTKKVDIIIGFLEGVQAGRVVADQNLIRKAAKICQMLPAIDSDLFERKFSEEITDALMMSFLSAITRTLHNLSHTADQYSSLYGEKKMGMSSMMF